MIRSVLAFLTLVICCSSSLISVEIRPESSRLFNITDAQFARYPGKSGVYVLTKGEESLLARAWLGDHAEKSIDVQYFIWSEDNIGLLATEALLRAADRGVRIRVLVDDFPLTISAQNILAISSHPQIDVRIYNPQSSIGVPWWKKYWNMLTQFRKFNQRMHDKTFIVDDVVAITGGRNMADEYYDYDHAYNFRDRDVLVMGPVVKEMSKNYESFWMSELSVPIEHLLPEGKPGLSQPEIQAVYDYLHAYAKDPNNYSDEVKQTLKNLPTKFGQIIDSIVWDEVQFLHDNPGKSEGSEQEISLTTSQALKATLGSAQRHVTIQSPYLVIPEGAKPIFQSLIEKGVKVQIVTNSLASTDNFYAFSGYRKRRKEILKMGIDVFEYKPHPAIEKDLMEAYKKWDQSPPVFAIHAKTMVIDGETLFIGTFNLDPRSAYLNTEVGILVKNKKLAQAVEGEIQSDMKPENSWNARTDNPDSFAPFKRKFHVWWLQLLPLDPIL